jgi:hypothetical protein
MATFTIGGKTALTQSGDGEPVVASNVVYGGNVTGTISSSATFPAGHVIQTIVELDSAYQVFGSSTYATKSSGWHKQITVKDASSLIFIQIVLQGAGKHSSNTRLGVKITESVTALDMVLSNVIGYTGSSATNYGNHTCVYFHTHAQAVDTVLDYTPQFNSIANSTNAGLNNYGTTDGDAKSYIILQEIAG